MVIIDTKDENMPQFPKSNGVYSRDNIGVTINGKRYINMLLIESLVTLITNVDLRNLCNSIFKFIFLR